MLIFKHVHISAQIKMVYIVRFLFQGQKGLEEIKIYAQKVLEPAFQLCNVTPPFELWSLKFSINDSLMLWFFPSSYRRGDRAGEGQCGDRCAASLTPAGDSSFLEALKE